MPKFERETAPDWRNRIVRSAVFLYMQVYLGTEMPDQMLRVTLSTEPISMKPYLLTTSRGEVLIRPAVCEKATRSSGEEAEYDYWFFATPVTAELRTLMNSSESVDSGHPTAVAYHARPAQSLDYDSLSRYRHLSPAELFCHNHHLDVIEAIKAELHTFDSDGATISNEHMVARPTFGTSNSTVDRCTRWKGALPFIIQKGSSRFRITPIDAFVAEGFEQYWYEVQEVEKHRPQFIFSRNGHDQRENSTVYQPAENLDSQIKLVLNGPQRRQVTAQKVVSCLSPGN